MKKITISYNIIICYLMLIILFPINCSAQQQIPNNWTDDFGIDTYEETTNINSGVYSCKVDVQANFNDDCDFVHDEINVSAGNSYTVSFYLQTSDHVKASISIIWVDISDTIYGTLSSIHTSGFTCITESGTIPSGVTSAKIGVRFYSQTGFSPPETSYIDDFSFESPTGTPVSFSNGGFEDEWPAPLPYPPTNTHSVAVKYNQINLSWDKNASGDDVLIAYNTEQFIGSPENGVSYPSGSSMPGGGYSLGTNSNQEYAHTSLSPNTHYYYSLWSVNGSLIYSKHNSFTETTTPDIKGEPQNHVTNFLANVVVGDEGTINLSWTDATGNPEPDGYLIKASTSGFSSITSPSDHVPVSDDTDLSDGTGSIKVNQGSGSYNWGNLNPNTTYYFKIFPYTNEDSYVDYKVDGTVPQEQETTDSFAQIGDIFITEIMQDPNDVSDVDGEWFELYNKSDSSFDINHWVISSYSLIDTIDNGTNPFIIQSKGFLIIGKNSVAASNGGVPVDYVLKTNFILGDSADEIMLKSRKGTCINKVAYDKTWSSIFEPGVSMIFTGNENDNNNLLYNWTKSLIRENSYTNPGNETDKGSPGTNGIYQNLMTSTTWTGTGNWSEGNSVGNNHWSNGSPGNKTDVTVNGDVLIDMDMINPAKCNNLTIQSNGSLSIEPSKALTVNGNITNNSGQSNLIIKSSSLSDASLIFSSGTTQATVQKYCPSGKYNFIGPSTLLSTANDFYINENDSADLFNFIESSNSWDPIISLTTPLDMGKGYAYWIYNEPGITSNIVTFSGEITSQDQSPNITDNVDGLDGGSGWNLLSNPFTSSLVFNNEWNISHVEKTIWIWDNGNNNYTPHIMSENYTIPLGKAFFIHDTINSGGTISIPASERCHQQSSGSLTIINEGDLTNKENQVVVSIFNESGKDIVRVSFGEEGSDNFENGFDASKLFGSSSSPQMYLLNRKTDDLKLTYDYVKSLNEIDTMKSIYLCLKPGFEGNYQLTADISKLNDYGLLLEDCKTGSIIDLIKNQTYAFYSELNDSPDRFILHFSLIPNGLTESNYSNNNLKYKIYTIEKHLIIENMYYEEESNTAARKNEKAYLYDIDGRLLFCQKLSGSSRTIINLTHIQCPIVIVKVVNDKNSYVKKCMFNKW